MKKHDGSCVIRLLETCAYLADGTKIVLRRDNKRHRAWLEVVPQALVHPAEKKADHRYGGYHINTKGEIEFFDIGNGNPMKNGG